MIPSKAFYVHLNKGIPRFSISLVKALWEDRKSFFAIASRKSIAFATSCALSSLD
jgi:hypothetical protein